MFWQTTRYRIALGRPQVMGIVNITPDSFSGGSQADTRAALAHCEQLLKDGADILDLGAESTRPGATQVPLAQELDRLLPVLREAVGLGVPVSVDTYKPRVMQAALDLGADIINDIWALRWQDPADPLDGRGVVAGHAACGICLMHMHGEPRTMQVHPMEGEVLPAVRAFLQAAAQDLRERGVAAERIVLDPGIGFGKRVEHNLALLARQRDAQDERRVRIALTDTGRALRAEAEKIPACVLRSTQCTLPELQALTGQLGTLRARLAPRRSHS